MSTVTLDDAPLVVVVPDGAPQEDWMEGRAEGVTASEIHDIAVGSRPSWVRILDAKLNGSTFRGNRHTRRGHEVEAEVLRQVEATVPGVLFAAPSNALYANMVHDRHRGTPDGLGVHTELGRFGVEIKWHEEPPRIEFPTEHADQCQWNMHVTGYRWWLYVWKNEGEQGIHVQWVPRDDTRIAFLIRQAEAFIAWRAAGAPELDDIPDEIDDALADYARGLALASEGDRLKSAARRVIEPYARRLAEGGDTVRKGGSRASLFYAPRTVEVLDEEAWKAAEPDTYSEWIEAKRRVNATTDAAYALYRETRPAPATLRITPNGEKP